MIVGESTAEGDRAKLDARGWKVIEEYGVLCPECFYELEARAARGEGER